MKKMRNLLFRKLFLFLYFVFLSPFSFTKETNTAPKTGPSLRLAAKGGSKRTTIEFEEQKIKGVRRIPLGSLITKERSDVKAELILMRKSWKSKILASAKRI